MDEQQTSNPQPEPPARPDAPGRVSANNIAFALIGALYLACLLLGLVAVIRGPKLGAPEEPKKTSEKSFFNLDMSSKDSIGILRIDGMIAMERQGWLQQDDMSDRLRKGLERFGKKKNVKAIIIKINSPGGTVATSQEIYRSVQQAKAKHKKPVIALMGDVAASGGYYIASACDVIVADPGTLTGSIGVIFHTMHFNELAKRFGVQFNTIKSGKYKDIGNSARPMLPDERELLQALIDNAYEQFLQSVSIGRKMPVEAVRKLADGRIYTGEQAAAAGLIDSAGGFHEAVERAKKLGGIRGEPQFVGESDLRETLITELLQGRLFFNTAPSGLLYLWTGF